MDKSINQIKKVPLSMERFINKLGLFYQKLGLPHISGRILGLLLTLEKPFSPEDIANLLKISRSSVSTNLKLLSMYGFLEEIRIPGVRRKYFIISGNAWENSLKVKIETYLPFQEILKEGIEGMKKSNKSPVLIEELMEYTNMEKKLYENFLKDWRKKIKRKKSQENV